MQNIKYFQKYLWEYDLGRLDLDKYADFFIERVAQRCDFEDLHQLSKIFGLNKIITVLNSSKNISGPRKSLILNILS